MGTGIGLTFTAVVILAMVVLFLGLYVRYRGKRIVICPETKAPVGAEINAALAAGTWMVTQPRFVVTACSRWPERAGCDQACAPQVEASPDETLASSRSGTASVPASTVRNRSARSAAPRWLPPCSDRTAHCANGTTSRRKICRRFWRAPSPSARAASWPKIFAGAFRTA